VPFLAFHLFFRVVSRRASAFGRFHGLAVNDPGAGLFMSSSGLPNLAEKSVVDSFPRSVFFPFGEAVVNRLPSREFVRKQPLGAAGPGHERDCANDLPNRPFIGPSTRIWPGYAQASMICP
jgi:hypothetical protein